MVSPAKAKPVSLHIDGVVYKEGQEFVAHALQLDLVVTAPTEEQAVRDLLDVIIAQVTDAFENDNLKYLFRSAPSEAWEKWRKIDKMREEPVQAKPKRNAWAPNLSFCYGAA